MGSMPYYETAFSKQGLVIPLFSNRNILDQAYGEIIQTPEPSDRRVEDILSRIYTPGHMAAMVLNRYPGTPFISDYQLTIGESVEAHFLGLNHVAVAGLIPVIEGAGRQLARSKGLEHDYIKQTFTNLTAHSITDVATRKIGDHQEVESVLNSFLTFLTNYFYSGSRGYPLSDKTNRNGITHGHFTDKDYGEPLNFYKTLGVLDCICLISSFQVFPAKSTQKSEALAMYYMALSAQKKEALAAYDRFLAGD